MAEGKSLLPSTGSPVTQRGPSARSLEQSSANGSVDEKVKEPMGFFEQLIHRTVMYETNEVVRLHWNHEIYESEQGRKYKWAVRTSICTYFGVSAVSFATGCAQAWRLRETYRD